MPGEPLHTGADLLTDKQAARLTALFVIDEHVEVEATWGIYQRMIAACRHPDPAAPPSASATSPTTSPDPYSRLADSDPDYTLHCEEALFLGVGQAGRPRYDGNRQPVILS